MPLSITDKISIANASSVFTSNELENGQLHGGSLEKRWPTLIHCVRQGMEWLSELNPAHADLEIIGNYLISICKHYGRAEQVIAGGGGGTTILYGVQNFPIYITNANFTTATFYPNTQLYGKNILVYLNEINRYLLPSTEFTVSTTGLTILLAGFDATANIYNLVIERVY